jgi:zinc protease
MKRLLILSFYCLMGGWSMAAPILSVKTLEKLAVEKLYNAQTFTLANGLQVYVIENHRVPAVSHTVVYRVGSADDPRGKAGLAHYLEHMMFKGPKGSNPERLTEEVERVGGKINASTSFDVTQYYEIIPKEYLERMIQLEASRMGNLPVRPEDAAPELKVVLEEENMRMGNNPFMQFYAAVRAAFYRHHPYGVMPIGYRDEIKTYVSQDVKDFHQRFYGPDNALVILAGDITFSEAKALCEKHYGPVPKRGIAPRKRVVEPPFKSQIQVTHHSDRVSDPYVVMIMGAPSLDTKAPDKAYALDLGAYALSNSATGILYRRLVEELKVATSFSISYDPYELDAGCVMIIAQAVPGVSPEKLSEMIHAELKKFLEKGMTPQALETYKIQLLSGLDYRKDSLSAGGEGLVAPLIKGVPLETIETWPVALKGLSPEIVNGVLKETLLPISYVLGYLLPEKKEKATGTPEGTASVGSLEESLHAVH